MSQGFAIHRLTEGSLRSALVIGTGYIGLEMADALHRRGIDVRVVEHLPQVMPTLAPSLGSLVEEALLDRPIKETLGARRCPYAEMLRTSSPPKQPNERCGLTYARTTPPARVARGRPR
jgi:NAD(P)H-nitrite reductase large subunit